MNTRLKEVKARLDIHEFWTSDRNDLAKAVECMEVMAEALEWCDRVIPDDAYEARKALAKVESILAGGEK